MPFNKGVYWSPAEISQAEETLRRVQSFEFWQLYRWLQGNDWNDTFAPLAGKLRTQRKIAGHTKRLFLNTLAATLGIAGHPKAAKLLELVWQDFCTDGYAEVAFRASRYSELLQ